MTVDEFKARHKRLFVALAAYGFRMAFPPCRWPEWHLIFNRLTIPCWVYLDMSDELLSRYPRQSRFAVVREGRPTYYFKHESSVLAALAKIHAGETP